MPHVSVIVPNFNHADFLAMRLQSIAQQTFQDIEIILVDDGSTDDSLAIMQSFRDQHDNVTLIESSPNSGKPFQQWQKGLALAKGDYIWIAESDDVATADFLTTLVKPLTENPECLMSVCASRTIDAENRPQGILQVANYQEVSAGQIIAGADFIQTSMSRFNSLPNVSAMVFRKTALENLDNDVLQLEYIGDWLMYLKILAQGDIAYHNIPLNYFRTHLATTRSKQDKNWPQLAREFGVIFEFLQRHDLAGNLNLSQINQNIEFLQNLQSNVSSKLDGRDSPRLAIYGAGALGIYCLHQLDGSVAIDCFIDQNYEAYPEQQMNNLPVQSLVQFSDSQSNAWILIASIAFYDEILDELSHVGLSDRVVNLLD